MEIARERFLDATRALHLTMGLRSRTTEAHSVLTALTPDERDRVSAGRDLVSSQESRSAG